jgi:hypothetical protein
LHDAPRCVGGTYRLDDYLDDPLIRRSSGGRQAGIALERPAGDGQGMTVSLSVEDFYNAFANQLDSALQFDECYANRGVLQAS